MKHPDAQVRLGSHWILPSPLAGMTHFRLKDGPITTLRFDGDRGEYAIAVGQGRSVAGPETQNNYVWMEVDDWPRWERLLINGPFIHHCAMGYGHWADAVAEACTFTPGVACVRLDARRRVARQPRSSRRVDIPAALLILMEVCAYSGGERWRSGFRRASLSWWTGCI